jgi:hypothetical protein
MPTEHFALGIDWSTWSKPRCNNNLEEILYEVFSQFTTQGERAWGGHGYRGHDLASYGNCCWRGADVMVDLPGRAMEYLRHHLMISDKAVCEWFLARGFKAKRIDIALDTTEPQFNPYVALKAWHQDLARCGAQDLWDFKFNRIVKGKPLFRTDGVGMTTYGGSVQGQRRIRIYDKVTEKLDKTGEIITDAACNEIKHLTRIELQHREEAATQAAGKIAKHGLAVIPALINGFVVFLNNRDCRQKRRKRVAGWWKRIVGKRQEFLELTKGTATPDDSICWIERQGAQTIKLIREKAPDVWKRLLDKADDYEVRKGVQKKWDAWETRRNNRKAELAEMEQIERDDKIVARIIKAHTEAGHRESAI